MNNKIIVVTGGTGSLGRFIVEKYAALGNKVYVPVRNMQKFNNLFDSSDKENIEYRLRKIYAFNCDADNETEIMSFIEQVANLENQKIDILINTIGGIHDACAIKKFKTEEFLSYFYINFMSAFWFSKYSLKYMQNNKFGRIVYIGSAFGIRPVAERLAYSVSKLSLSALMETLNRENREFNIKSNLIIPGVIDTPANRKWGKPEDFDNWIKPQDIADIIFDITTDHFKYLENSTIKLYGD